MSTHPKHEPIDPDRYKAAFTAGKGETLQHIQRIIRGTVAVLFRSRLPELLADDDDRFLCEAVQIANVKLLEDLRGKRSFVQYEDVAKLVSRVAANCAFDVMRAYVRAQKEKPIESGAAETDDPQPKSEGFRRESTPDEPQAVADDESIEALFAAHKRHLPEALEELREVSPDQHRALVLKYHEELSTKDIAVRMHRSADAVTALLSRGREALREILSRRNAAE